jgi:hypothetical protein
MTMQVARVRKQTFDDDQVLLSPLDEVRRLFYVGSHGGRGVWWNRQRRRCDVELGLSSEAGACSGRRGPIHRDARRVRF